MTIKSKKEIIARFDSLEKQIQDFGLQIEHLAITIDGLCFAQYVEDQAKEIKKSKPENHYIAWTEADDETLRKGVAKGLTYEEIAAYMGRTKESIVQRWTKKGKEKAGDIVFVNSRTHKVWTPEELDDIWTQAENGTPHKDIAERYGVSPSAIDAQLAIIRKAKPGYKRPFPSFWTPAEDRIILENALRPIAYQVKVLADAGYKRSYRAISHRRQILSKSISAK